MSPIRQFDHVGITVADLDAVSGFFDRSSVLTLDDEVGTANGPGQL